MATTAAPGSSARRIVTMRQGRVRHKSQVPRRPNDGIARQLADWLAPFAVLLVAAAIPWAGVFSPLVVEAHYAFGVVAASAVGVCLTFLWFRWRPSVATSAALVVGTLLMSYAGAVALVERAHLSPADMGSFATRTAEHDPAELAFWVFVVSAIVIGIARFWQMRKVKREPVVHVISWPTRVLGGMVWVLSLFVCVNVSGIVIHELTKMVSRHELLPEVVTRAEELLGFEVLDDAQFTRLVLNDTYLYASRLPRRAVSAISTMEDANMVLVQAGDPYSHVSPYPHMTRAEMSTGLMLSRPDNGARRVLHVHPHSTADQKGLLRGQEVILCADPGRREGLKECGPAEKGFMVLLVPGEDGAGERIRLEYKPIKDFGLPAHGSFQVNGRWVGYVLLTEFTEQSARQFDAVARMFKDKSVNDLIVDLRVNGGGRQWAMSSIAAAMVDSATRRHPLGTTSLNRRYAHRNGEAFGFNTLSWEGLSLERVIFLTSRNTVSASEILITSLRDHIRVVTVGERTIGKGQGCVDYRRKSWNVCLLEDSYTSWRGTSVPADGIAPDIPVKDDFRFPLGDPQDPLFQAAVDFLGRESSRSRERD